MFNEKLSPDELAALRMLSNEFLNPLGERLTFALTYAAKRACGADAADCEFAASQALDAYCRRFENNEP